MAPRNPGPPTLELNPVYGNRQLRRKVGRARSRAARKGPSARTSKLPPILDTVAQGHSVLRFTATSAAASAAVTIGNVLMAIGGIGTIANSTVTSVASSVKLHKITIWPASTSAGAGQNAEVIWSNQGNYAKDESKSSVVPTGTTLTDVVVSRPPLNGSLQSAWQASAGAATQFFALTCPAGSIIDIDVSWTLSNNFVNVAQAGYAAVTLGSLYYARLDGVGGKFLPLGVPTTN